MMRLRLSSTRPRGNETGRSTAYCRLNKATAPYEPGLPCHVVGGKGLSRPSFGGRAPPTCLSHQRWPYDGSDEVPPIRPAIHSSVMAPWMSPPNEADLAPTIAAGGKSRVTLGSKTRFGDTSRFS